MPRFNPIEFVTRFGGNQIVLKVLSETGPQQLADDLFEDQCLLLEQAAFNAAKGVWDSKYFLQNYPNTRDFFLGLVEDERARIEWSNRVAKLRDSSRTGLVTVYCPRGCNQIQVDSSEPWDECGACGQMMTERAEDDYYVSLVECGHAM